uniref:Nuclear envelope pore membrane protein POM 121C n=1 Tax=Sphenodon punctatus TaxID=8508 RepID=A0A8D0L1I5_SPHPU
MGNVLPGRAGGKRGQLGLPGPARRMDLGDHLTPPTHFVLAPRRRYPIQQAQYSSLGTLPFVHWDGYQRKSLLSACNSNMVHSPVTVKIARPDSNLPCSPFLEQLVSPVALPSSKSTLDPCAKETVLSALKESRKRAVEEEEDQNFPSTQENKRRRHDSSGSGQSAFEPLVANGAPASLIPKPGSLKRGLISHSSDDCLNKRSRTSSISCVNNMYAGGIPSSIRNAIASSYSSTRGFSQVWKQSVLSTSPLSSPASSRSQTPERPNKKAREEEHHQSSTSTPVKSNKELLTENAVETSVNKRQNSLSSPSPSERNGKRKRKIQLLSTRRGDQLTLPPPPQLGYPVTAEDLDAEKAAALQWFNKVLKDKTVDSTSSPVQESTSISKSLSVMLTSTGPTAVSPAPPAASTNSLLESLKNMQESWNSPVLSDLAEAAAVSPPPSTAPLLAPAVPLDSGPLPGTSSEAKPVPMLNLPTLMALPSSAVLPASSTSTLGIPTVSDLGLTPARPPSSPKPSILFGMLNSQPASQPVTTATSASTSTFKPIFGTMPKSETAAVSVASTPAAIVAPSGPSPVTTSMFKPIFGNVVPPAAAASALATVTPFTLKQMSSPASASTTGTSMFTGLPSAISTTMVSAPATCTACVTTDSATKPAFSFGLGTPITTTAPSSTAVTAATTSASQPFLFGATSTPIPSTKSAGSTATAPLFQFGKPAVTTAPATSVSAGSAFGQAPLNMPQTALTNTTAGGSLSIFGGTTLASSAPAATTQPALTFGSSTSTFGGVFGIGAKAPPSYPGTASHPAFGNSAPDSQQPTTKPAAGPGSFFCTPFSFSSSTSQPAAQPAFGSTTQPPFAGTDAQASFGTSSTQPAFGGTTSVFSFGTATTSTASGFGSNTQTTNSATGSSVFGGTTVSPFAFGISNPPSTGPSAFGIAAPAPSTGTPAVTFNFGAGQTGGVSAAVPFGSSPTQNALGAQNQSTPFMFTVPSTPDNKLAFGGTPTPFGQSTPAPGGGAGGSSLSFGTPGTSASAFGGAGPSFGTSTPAFSIGAGSKTGARQRLQARRQHTRKK